MKILLKFFTLTPQLPYDYRRIILSFFKKSLSSVAEGKYFEEYYSIPERRDFVFAVRLPKSTFANDTITLSKNEISVVFSTGNSKAGFVFMSAFIAQKNKSMPMPMGNSLTLRAVTQISEKNVSSGSAMINFRSPLCLREHKKNTGYDYYYSVNHKEFGEKSKEIICSQLKLAGFDEQIVSNFSIEPINAKKTVVTHYDCKVECSLGDFVIKADKSVINYLLKYGVGSRVSSGFGLAELVAEGEVGEINA